MLLPGSFWRNSLGTLDVFTSARTLIDENTGNKEEKQSAILAERADSPAPRRDLAAMKIEKRIRRASLGNVDMDIVVLYDATWPTSDPHQRHIEICDALNRSVILFSKGSSTLHHVSDTTQRTHFQAFTLRKHSRSQATCGM